MKDQCLVPGVRDYENEPRLPELTLEKALDNIEEAIKLIFN